jgi:hypothetical protein
MFLAFVTMAIGPATAISEELPDDPRKYFGSLLESRTSIKSLHVEWSLTVLKDSNFPQLEGCRHEYEGWYDFQTGARRVNERVACPGAHELSANPRFSFDGSVYRIIERDDVMGYEVHGFDQHHMSAVDSRVFNQSTDIRLVGLFPVPYSVLKNFSLANLLSYVNGPNTTIAHLGGKTRIQVDGLLDKSLSAVLHIDPETGMPSRIETDVASIGLRRELQCTWRKYTHNDGKSSSWFPVTLKTRAWQTGKALTEEELVEIKNVDIGKPVSTDIYQWKSLAPVNEYAVEFRHDNKRIKVEQWDANKSAFVPWTPTPLASADVDTNDPGAIRWSLLIVNLIVIVFISGWIAISRLRKPE